jgi:hypothetical protein
MADKVFGKIRLQMTQVSRSNRWKIGLCNKADPAILIPPDPRIEELWKIHAPRRGELFVGSTIEGTTNSFYVDVGPHSKPTERNKFLEALAAECQLPDRV